MKKAESGKNKRNSKFNRPFYWVDLDSAFFCWLFFLFSKLKVFGYYIIKC